jgi:hypothetical protein
MKTLFMLLMLMLPVSVIFSQSENLSSTQKSEIVDNLNVGINSDNNGLRTSSADVLSDLVNDKYLDKSDASKSMIPLLIMLENGKSDEERISAALALYNLGNPIGIYRLRGVAVYDNNEKVSTVCKNLYYTYHKLHGTEYLVDL